MVDRNEVYEIADRLLQQGILVSVRSVRNGLAHGGSFEDLGPLVQEWKLARRYLGKLSTMDVSEPLANMLARQVATLRQAVEKDESEYREERESLALQRQISGKVDRMVDVLSRAAAALSDAGSANGNPGKSVVEEVSGRSQKGRLNGAAAAAVRAFWDALMQEIADSLGDESLTARQIAERIRPETRAFAARMDLELTVPRIQAAMTTRCKAGKYFEKKGDKYVLRAGRVKQVA